MVLGLEHDPCGSLPRVAFLCAPDDEQLAKYKADNEAMVGKMRALLTRYRSAQVRCHGGKVAANGVGRLSLHAVAPASPSATHRAMLCARPLCPTAHVQGRAGIMRPVAA